MSFFSNIPKEYFSLPNNWSRFPCPYLYHATTKAGACGIVTTGEIRGRPDVWVGTIPIKFYGDFVFALKIEKMMKIAPGRSFDYRNPTKPYKPEDHLRYGTVWWMRYPNSIEIDQEHLGYILIEDVFSRNVRAMPDYTPEELDEMAYDAQSKIETLKKCIISSDRAWISVRTIDVADLKRERQELEEAYGDIEDGEFIGGYPEQRLSRPLLPSLWHSSKRWQLIS